MAILLKLILCGGGGGVGGGGANLFAFLIVKPNYGYVRLRMS